MRTEFTAEELAALADLLAREIFSIGDEPIEGGGPVQRIAYKCGTYPDGEVEGGGLCEGALSDAIRNALPRCLKAAQLQLAREAKEKT